MAYSMPRLPRGLSEDSIGLREQRDYTEQKPVASRMPALPGQRSLHHVEVMHDAGAGTFDPDGHRRNRSHATRGTTGKREPFAGLIQRRRSLGSQRDDGIDPRRAQRRDTVRGQRGNSERGCTHAYRDRVGRSDADEQSRQ